MRKRFKQPHSIGVKKIQEKMCRDLNTKEKGPLVKADFMFLVVMFAYKPENEGKQKIKEKRMGESPVCQ